jgi:hypothetical protein
MPARCGGEQGLSLVGQSDHIFANHDIIHCTHKLFVDNKFLMHSWKDGVPGVRLKTLQQATGLALAVAVQPWQAI